LRTICSVSLSLFWLLFFAVVFAIHLSSSPAISQSNDRLVNGNKGFVEINGVKHFFYVLGKGEPLVVLHGGPGTSHEYFLPHLNPLSDLCKIIFYDQRASGNSSKPADANTVTADYFVKDLEGIRIAFGLEKMRLMGHSWGGLLALLYAFDYPDRIKSLVLIDSAPPNSELDSLNLRIREERRDPKDRKEMGEIMNSEEFKQLDPDAITRFFKVSEKVRFYNPSLMDKMSLNLDRERIEKLMWVSQLMNSYLSDYDIGAKLARIRSPTLIIHGDYDSIPVEAAEILHENIKNSKLVVIEKCGHFPFVEAPDRFMKEVREFLEKNK
jgi:proline iminopeptidase